jgi:hypothetical protein
MNTRKVEIHPSSLDLVSRCGAAYQFADENYGNPMTQFGTAGHEALQQRATMEPVNWQVIKEKYGLTDTELNDIQWMVGAITFNFHPDDAVIEHKFVVPIPGTEAVVSCRPDVIVKPGETRPCPQVHDYKFGYKEVLPDSLQFKTYAWAVTEMGKCDCEVYVHMNRSRETKTIYYTDTELQDYTMALQTFAANIEKIQFVCGTHCDELYCPGRVYCKPYREEMNRLAPLVVQDELTLTPENMALFIRKMKMIENALKRGREIANAYVQEHGPLDLGDGYEYRAVAGTKQELDIEGAIARLRDAYGDAFVLAAAKLTKTGIVDTCRNKGMPWHKRGLSTEVLTLLERGNCFKTIETSTCKVVKKAAGE